MDIGSNTSLLLIACLSKENPSDSKILEDQLFFTRLAQFELSVGKVEPFFKKNNDLRDQERLQKKSYLNISYEAFERQKLFFKTAKELVHQYSVEKVKCVATAAARQAQNAKELLLMGKKYGFSIDIISAAEEARISRQGALFQLSVDPISAVVLDIGGASTEISTAHQCFSLPIGSVNLTEEFIHNDPPEEEEIILLTKKIQRELNSIPFSFSKKSLLVAVAGTPTTLATLENKTDNLKDLHGQTLSVEQVQHWWEYLFNLSFEKRKNLEGMPVYRADVMPAGLSILKQVMHQFQWSECVVSITGLRYGLLCQI